MEQLLAWKGVAVGLWLVLFFLLERALPKAPLPAAVSGAAEAGADPWTSGWRRVARNLGLWLLNVGLSPLVVIPVSVWAAAAGPAWRPEWLTGGWSLLLDLLLLDLLIYWWHRFNHVVPFLWRFHEVHHLDAFLDSTTALRFHFGEVLLSAAARALFILAFDIPLVSILVFAALVLIAAIFHHSNLALPEGLERALARVVITPGIHWIHHHAVRRDTDSNYGTILSIWDPLFGSRSPNPRRLDMPIGVERLPEKGFLALLARPFRVSGRGRA